MTSKDSIVNGKKVGVVVIGRNEGERLRRCLSSIPSSSVHIVYVDSGSSDHSVEIAYLFANKIIELNSALPFSAARARNEGFLALSQLYPETQFVQFIDGDCEINGHWLGAASRFLEVNKDVAIVNGRLNERFPEISIYNKLANLEWNSSSPGDVDAVGGIFMVRAAVFESVEGFNETVTAGEEPELCQRIKDVGWRLVHLDVDMAWHDLAMKNFGSWWMRQIRGGYGGLDVARRFGITSFIKNNWRARFWSIWPILIVLGWGLGGWFVGELVGMFLAFSIAMLWPIQFVRILLRTWRNGQTIKLALAYSWFTMLSFWPQMLGQIYYIIDGLFKRNQRLIEYNKTSAEDSH